MTRKPERCIQDPLQRAMEAAGARGVGVGGDVARSSSTCGRSLVDEMHFAIAPTFLGSGENLFSGINVGELGYRCVKHLPSEATTHIVPGRSTS